MKKLLTFIVLISLFFFVACGSSEDIEREEPVESEDPKVIEEESTKDNENEGASDEAEDQEEQNDSTEDETNQSGTGSEIQDETNRHEEQQESDTEMIKTGLFNGQADPHTIEVETDDGPVAYQLTMEARDLVSDLEPGDSVKYTYYKDDEMLVIKYIEKVD